MNCLSIACINQRTHYFVAVHEGEEANIIPLIRKYLIINILQIHLLFFNYNVLYCMWLYVKLYDVKE